MREKKYKIISSLIEDGIVLESFTWYSPLVRDKKVVVSKYSKLEDWQKFLLKLLKKLTDAGNDVVAQEKNFFVTKSKVKVIESISEKQFSYKEHERYRRCEIAIFDEDE